MHPPARIRSKDHVGLAISIEVFPRQILIEHHVESVCTENNAARAVVNGCRTTRFMKALPFPRSQNTARFCVLALVASENRGSDSARSSSFPVTYSPKAGPCLNPCPEPPPTNQTFSIPGCWSIRKSPFEVFSYWHTR